MSKTLRNIFLGIVLFLMSGPLVVVSGVSLNAKKRLFFPPEGVSLRWYVELLTESSWLVPVKNSLVIALSSSLLALSIALPLGYFLWRYRVFYARALFTLRFDRALRRFAEVAGGNQPGRPLRRMRNSSKEWIVL